MTDLARYRRMCYGLVALLILGGCMGAPRVTDPARTAVEQLLLSTAVDRALAVVDLSALAGKKVYLWIGATDGRAKVFVNGKHIKYTVPNKTRHHEVGEEIDAFSGYCKAGTFDITAALKTGDNQFTILCDRYHLNELGTGGLMGPVVVYREK